jgi:hypothetical protein
MDKWFREEAVLCLINPGCVKNEHEPTEPCGVGPGTCQHFLGWRDCSICAKLATREKTVGGKR